MRAIAYHEYGDESVLDLVELPTPNVGHFRALVRVKAAGVNPIDNKIRQGKMDGVIDTFFPVVPGWYLAGVVEEVHYTADTLQPGDEVIGCLYPDYLHHGSYAEFVPVPVRALARKPSNATWEQSAGLPTAGLTSYQALKAIGMREGDTLLVHGASGGLGSLTAQIAHILGAHVIGTASERNHQFLRGLGVEPVRYGDGWADRVRALAPAGVDCVIDLYGSGLLGESAPLLAQGVGPDRMVTVADRIHAADIGARWIGVRPDGEDLSQLVTWVEDGALTVHVSEVLPLAEAATAHRMIAAGHTRGKIVLSVA